MSVAFRVVLYLVVPLYFKSFAVNCSKLIGGNPVIPTIYRLKPIEWGSRGPEFESRHSDHQKVKPEQKIFFCSGLTYL